MAKVKTRLVKAVEAFLVLRQTIFPVVHGDVECAALWELEEALKEAGGRIFSDNKKWLKQPMKTW